MGWSAELSFGDTVLGIGDGSDRSGGVTATADGIEGWYSTPESKWELTERSYSDGAFAIGESDIVYAARAITLNLYAEGGTREKVVENHHAILAAAHHECTLRVIDGGTDTCVTGYATVEDSGGRITAPRDEVTLTLECPDPRRYASEGSDGYQLLTLEPSSVGASGGLSYGEDAAGLAYDLSYGAVDGESGNVGTLTPGGSATAYPLITVYGKFSEGFAVLMETGGTLYTVEYGRAVSGTPVVLDYLNRSATVGGADRSRYLTSRGFHGIEPGDSATFNLQAVGSGYAVVVVRDTYM